MEREREKWTDRGTEVEKQTETDTEREGETERGSERHRDKDKETERQRELFFFCGFIVYFVYPLPMQLEFVPVSNRVFAFFRGNPDQHTLAEPASFVGKGR